ncbi:MAG: hypothetical protein JWQ09_118 [Segetibacter sp.]|nr:hypothetical protein [Segetibacter sp.]
MIYSKNTHDVLLLRTELRRLKKLYSEALKKENDFLLKDLRKRIKLLSARLLTCNNPIISINS